MMTPNMTISSSPELLRASREAADRMGLRTSIHLGWGEYEVEVMRRLRGRTSFEYARDMGMLASDTVCAHATWWASPTPTCSRRRGPPSRTAR